MPSSRRRRGREEEQKQFTYNRSVELEIAHSPEMGRFLEAIAAEAAEDAKRQTRSERVAAGIGSDQGHDAKGRYGAVTVPGSRDAGFIWIFEEFGTSRKSAHPFLRPALEVALRRRGGRFDTDRS